MNFLKLMTILAVLPQGLMASEPHDTDSASAAVGASQKRTETLDPSKANKQEFLRFVGTRLDQLKRQEEDQVALFEQKRLSLNEAIAARRVDRVTSDISDDSTQVILRALEELRQIGATWMCLRSFYNLVSREIDIYMSSHMSLQDAERQRSSMLEHFMFDIAEESLIHNYDVQKYALLFIDSVPNRAIPDVSLMSEGEEVG
jgi:hypothetical protein